MQKSHHQYGTVTKEGFYSTYGAKSTPGVVKQLDVHTHRILYLYHRSLPHFNPALHRCFTPCIQILSDLSSVRRLPQPSPLYCALCLLNSPCLSHVLTTSLPHKTPSLSLSHTHTHSKDTRKKPMPAGQPAPHIRDLPVASPSQHETEVAHPPPWNPKAPMQESTPDDKRFVAIVRQVAVALTDHEPKKKN